MSRQRLESPHLERFPTSVPRPEEREQCHRRELEPARLNSVAASPHAVSPVPTGQPDASNQSSPPESEPEPSPAPGIGVGSAASDHSAAMLNRLNLDTRASAPGTQQPSAANSAEFKRALEAQVERGVAQAAYQAAAAGVDGGGSVTLRLQPANLGFLRVTLRLDGGSRGGVGGVRARFESSSSRTRDLLGGSIDSLRPPSRERGMKVDGGRWLRTCRMRCPDAATSGSRPCRTRWTSRRILRTVALPARGLRGTSTRSPTAGSAPGGARPRHVGGATTGAARTFRGSGAEPPAPPRSRSARTGASEWMP